MADQQPGGSTPPASGPATAPPADPPEGDATAPDAGREPTTAVIPLRVAGVAAVRPSPARRRWWSWRPPGARAALPARPVGVPAGSDGGSHPTACGGHEWADVPAVDPWGSIPAVDPWQDAALAEDWQTPWSTESTGLPAPARPLAVGPAPARPPTEGPAQWPAPRPPADPARRPDAALAPSTSRHADRPTTRRDVDRPAKTRRSAARPTRTRPEPERTPPIPRRRRRRWGRNLLVLTLLSVACCCGPPAYFIWPAARQYPASVQLPQSVADLQLRDDDTSGRIVEKLTRELRTADLLADDVFAAVYGDRHGKRVTVYGSTGLQLTPRSAVEDHIQRMAGEYHLTAVEKFDLSEPGAHQRCGTGRADGAALVVCTWADHGSQATVLLTRRSPADSAELVRLLREAVLVRG